MRHEQFRVGIEFRCAGKRWRCTDIGKRVIVAVCLEPGEEDEQIFHEYDLPACTLAKDAPG